MQILRASGRDNLHNGGLGHILGENLAKLRNADWHHGLSFWGDRRSLVFMCCGKAAMMGSKTIVPITRQMMFFLMPIICVGVSILKVHNIDVKC